MHLTPDDVRALLSEDQTTVVSIYITTEPKAYRSEQNSLRFRSALNNATRQLEKRRLARNEIHKLMTPLRGLLDDERFWLHQGNGLALFRSESNLETVRLAFQPPESVRVADAPYVVPLLEGLETGERHAILAISASAVRLLSCTQDDVEEVDTDDLKMPRSLAEAMRYEDLQKPETLHHPTTGPGRAVPRTRTASTGRGDRKHGFHGHGESDTSEKTYMANFLHQVDAALLRRLHELGSPPMILAAVDNVAAMYQGISKYQPLTNEVIEGSPDALRPETLLDRARPILEERLRSKTDAALARFHELAAQGRATAKLPEVVDAADVGRVETLLVKRGASVWGRFDATSREIELSEPPEGNSDVNDLMDLAARRTLTNHGTVLILDPDTMIDPEAQAAATLRY